MAETPEEILTGVHHWTAKHPKLGVQVSSHYHEPSATLLDPLIPDEVGLDWFRDHGPPRRVVLTNRHHLRHSEEFGREFGCPILCNERGLHEFEGGPAVEGFAVGTEVAPGVRALENGAICPDDTALLIDAGEGALALADAVVNYDGIRLVPDSLLGDDPEAVKRDIRTHLERLLEEDFHHVLFAHGDPIVGDGRARLREFVQGS